MFSPNLFSPNLFSVNLTMQDNVTLPSYKCDQTVIGIQAVSACFLLMIIVGVLSIVLYYAKKKQ